jgi:hypothetical protein
MAPPDIFGRLDRLESKIDNRFDRMEGRYEELRSLVGDHGGVLRDHEIRLRATEKATEKVEALADDVVETTGRFEIVEKHIHKQDESRTYWVRSAGKTLLTLLLGGAITYLWQRLAGG